MSEKTKLHIERLDERNKQELLLIASGAVFNLISSQMLGNLSDVELAMDLGVSIPLIRKAIATLATDGLITQDYQGDWAIAPLGTLKENPQLAIKQTSCG
jgi:hypothetical protein